MDFYNVHANAYNNPGAAAARRKNIMQLSDYISKHTSENAIIVMGDLNGHYSYSLDNIKLLNTKNGLQDIWVEKLCKGSYPDALSQMPASNILGLRKEDETIDKILYRSGTKLQLTPVSYHFENQIFNNDKGIPLSDHHPVSARFKWSTALDHASLTD